MKRALSPSATPGGNDAINAATKRPNNKKKCTVVGCGTMASFGYIRKKPEYCVRHRLSDMVDVVNNRCGVDGCRKQPGYGYTGEKSTRCDDHRAAGMIKLTKANLCEAEGCTIRASYGLSGDKAMRCKGHIQPGMIDLHARKCSFDGCNKICNFGIPGEQPTRCLEHCCDRMIDVRHRKCTTIGCSTRPSFGFVGGPATKCARHREADMLDLVSALCTALGCGTQASYGYLGGKLLFCAKHKEPGSVSTRSNMCLASGCTTTASFGFVERQPSYCRLHRLSGMMDVVHTKCTTVGCSLRPSYGLPGGMAVVCSGHREPDMLNLVDRKCIFEGCLVRAHYGVPGFPPILCAEHKTKPISTEDGTSLRVTNNPSKKCHCKQPATHGIRKPERCETHALCDDMNLVESPCTRCSLVFRLDPRTQQCAYCYADSVHKPKLAKQREVKQYLQYQCPDLPAWTSCDRAPQELKDCRDYERPDFMWADWDGDRAWSLVLEVDENQHETYPIWCECARQVNITEDMGRYTLWIRYNPDSYKPARPGQRQVPQAERLAELARHVRGALATLPVEPKHSGAVLWLFFDGYDSEAPNVDWMYL